MNGLSGTRLIEWTTDKYGPPVSYSEVSSLANYFDITVDGGGRCNEYDIRSIENHWQYEAYHNLDFLLKRCEISPILLAIFSCLVAYRNVGVQVW